MQSLQGKWKWFDLGARLVVAALLLQTLFFKFTGAAESVAIFETLGVEPWGRIATGVMELAAAVLLLVPSTAGLGALLALGVLSGAIVSHLLWLGIEVEGDGGTLFGMAVLLFALSGFVAFLRRAELPIVGAVLRTT